jgi:3-hydroxyisobutyrate dehydrogenase
MTDPNIHKEPMPQVAVIGTGAMGTAMARRLLGARMNVAVWSRHPASTMSLVDQGATAYDAASDAAKDADVVITMLATAEATAEVMFDGQTVDAMKPGSIWAQMATIGVEATEGLATQARTLRPDVVFVDAPVSGSREPAEKGQLLILASGPQSVVHSLEPVFGALSRATLWLGPVGSGSRMKLILNTWLAFQIEGAAEAAALAERLGVSTSALFAALDDNPLASRYALAKLAKMLDEDYHADFALDWALKDLDLAASVAGTGVLPVVTTIADRWRGLVRQGSGGLDVSAARRGLESTAPIRPSRRWPEWIATDPVVSDNRLSVST